MSWIFFAILSYLLSAVAVILDKFLLGSRRVSHPAVYAFYVGMLGLGALIFVPFGFSMIPAFYILTSIISGIFYTFALLLLYVSIQRAQASQVMPVTGAVIPMASYLFLLVLAQENLSGQAVLGVALLIIGGLLISFDLPLRIEKKKFFSGFYQAVGAGLLLALAYTLFKYIYESQTFVNGFIWTRLGAVAGIFIFFFVPSWRRAILGSLRNFRAPQQSHYHTGAIFVSNKLLAGTGSLLFNYAIALGSVTVVNSMVSVQYVFIFLLALLAAKYYPKVFEERLTLGDWLQKIGAIAIIALGIFLVSHIANVSPLP